MSLTTTTLLVLTLYLVQLFLQETTRYRFDLGKIVGNRDEPPPMSLVAARLDRAKNNLLEALPFFLGLTMLAFAKGRDEGLAAQGAEIFLAARVLYVPAYVSGIPALRSALWLVANAGLVLIAWALF